MEKLYIVFDQLPPSSGGGLVATYVRLADLLKNDYDIEIISIFDCDNDNKTQFKNNKINIINKYNLDIRFYKMFKYLKNKQFKLFFKAIKSSLYYFIKIPSTRLKIRKLIQEKDNVIVTCPSAGIFMTKKRKFILEVHIDYKYFFGNNLLGSMQAKIMRKPTLTLFRSKDSADHAPKHLNPNYIYNFFDNTNSKRSKKLIKNKILFFGRFEKQKNPSRLIDMAYELKKINKNFVLDMYGTGSLLDETLEKIKKLKLEDVVHYKGFIDDKNIYNKYSLLWLTSDFEGLALVIIEAKACGIPTISTEWGNAVYEEIENNEDGYVTSDNKTFVEYTNKVLTDEKLQKKLSDNAYKNFKKFSKENARKNWIEYLSTYKK